ncbi:MAG: SurA N-terminal domain-containing protein [Desulfobacterales bacterium]|nr:SurA N-terminal domain-containing protein [Desulfobacterales bacterium]
MQRSAGRDRGGVLRGTGRIGSLAMAGMLLLSAAFAAGCTDSAPDPKAPYLVRIGRDAVSVIEYRKALELARAAYPYNELQVPEVDRAIRVRVLRELTEELILRQRARELGISVTEAEIEQAVDRIRSDYPEEEFQKAILENAVSYAAWKERLKARLLIQKLIREDLENRIQISAKDVSTYCQAHRRTLIEDSEQQEPLSPRKLDERIVKELRRKKAEEAYIDWIEALRGKYQIDINLAQWQRIESS